jgi:hypothetical protein
VFGLEIGDFKCVFADFKGELGVGEGVFGIFEAVFSDFEAEFADFDLKNVACPQNSGHKQPQIKQRRGRAVLRFHCDLRRWVIL